MRIVQVQNHPRFGGGADVLFNNTIDLLGKKGESVIPLSRRTSSLGTGLSGKLKAFTSGLYSRSAYKTMRNLIENEKPDIVHVHDLYPLLVWVLQACGDAGVPVVMTCHNYRFTCPTMFHFRNGQVCDECSDGHEYRCVLNNCRRNIFESTAYALHNTVARKSSVFMNNVTLFIALTEFSMRRLQMAGVPKEKIVILPNMMNLPTYASGVSTGVYVGYVGRFSAEKGIDLLLSAAARNPGIPFQLAGNYSTMPELLANAPENVQFVGQIDGLQLCHFYERCRFIIVPSKWFEVCPMVVVEAMGYGLPVVASRIGSLKEMVNDGVTGILFEPGNIEDLASKIRMMWEDSHLCKRIGIMARQKATQEYNSEVYYSKLIALYRQAVQMKQS